MLPGDNQSSSEELLDRCSSPGDTCRRPRHAWQKASCWDSVLILSLSFTPAGRGWLGALGCCVVNKVHRFHLKSGWKLWNFSVFLSPRHSWCSQWKLLTIISLHVHNVGSYWALRFHILQNKNAFLCFELCFVMCGRNAIFCATWPSMVKTAVIHFCP